MRADALVEASLGAAVRLPVGGQVIARRRGIYFEKIPSALELGQKDNGGARRVV